jgi:hypothetical protein
MHDGHFLQMNVRNAFTVSQKRAKNDWIATRSRVWTDHVSSV